MIDINKYPPVLIEWTDARGGYTEWHYESDGCLDDGIITVYTIGFLLRKTKDRITVVMNMSDPKDKDVEFCDIMHIPRKAIKRIVNMQVRI